MVDEIKPYQLVEIYQQSRHTRVNSWVYSLLALASALVGFGLQFSEVPRRSEGAIACWMGSAALCHRAKAATQEAEKYQHRRDVLEWASEEATLTAIIKSVQPSLPALTLPSAIPERALILPSGNTPLESFASAVQQLLARDLELRTDFVNILSGPQLIQLHLRPHDLKKVKQLQGEAVSDSIQALLQLPESPVITLDHGAIALSIARPDRQFCHFTDYIQPVTDGALRMAIGVNIRGKLVETELSGQNLQHYVLGGAPRQGKSQWILSAMGSLVDRYSPQQIRFVLGDGKGGVTLGFMQGSPYLLQPVAYSRSEALPLVEYLKELVESRYTQFRAIGAQTIDDYLTLSNQPMPFVMVVWDEFQDLFNLSNPKSEELPALESLSSLAPAAGIFFIWSSQRIDGKLLPPQINSKCLSRVCLKVQKDRDSDFVLNGDTSGVNLLGQGDLIYDDGHTVQRLQGLYLPNRHDVFGKNQTLAPGVAAPPLEPVRQEFKAPTAREVLENSFKIPATKEHEPVEEFEDENLKSLAQYLQKKREISVRDVKYSWGSNRGFKADQVDDFLIQLMQHGSIETYTPDGCRAERLKWLK